MPCLKQPGTLYKIALLRVQILLINTCKNINNRRSRKVICNVQDHVINSIGSLIHDVGNKTINHFINQSNCEKNTKTYLSDGKKLVCLFIHPEVENFLLNINELHRKVCLKLPVGDRFFWSDNIKTMKNVVKMNLCFICDIHNVFRTIGGHCKKLQELFFDSSKASHDNHFRMRHLVDCRDLRVIHDVSTRFLHYELEYLREFIRQMPRLTVLNVDNLGRILSGTTEDLISPLALTEATERKSNPTHIRALSACCPYLNKLTLETSDNVNGEDDMKALSESPFLLLTKLSIKSWFYQFEMINIALKNKGEHLTNLHIHLMKREGFILNKWDVLKIGRFCPNLKSLYLYYLVYELIFHECYNEVQRTPAEDDVVSDKDVELFRNLTSLDIGGTLCWRQEIVELLLRNATRITEIAMHDTVSEDWQHSVGALIDLGNRMSELKSLALDCDYRQLSPENVSRLYYRFDYLKSISIRWYNTSEDQTMIRNRVAEIQNMIRENNYDISFKLLNEK